MPQTSRDPEAVREYNRQYYLRTRQLKGRAGKNYLVPKPRKAAGTSRPSGKPGKKPVTKADTQKTKERVGRLKEKIAKLQGALSEAQAALVEKRGNARKREKANSDGKTTAKERQSSKEYRERNSAEIAAKRKKESSSGGSKSSSNSSSNSVSDMSVEELEDRISRIQGAIKDAKRQLSNAQGQLGQLAHSVILSEPNVNVLFAQFKQQKGFRQNDSGS